MKHFWNWLTPEESSPDSDGGDRVLRINGVIAEESWLDDDITPTLFASELNAGSGPITIWLNSPGGDVVAAARIYNMLLDYPGKVTVNIDGIAASAASVIAKAASSSAFRQPVSLSRRSSRNFLALFQVWARRVYKSVTVVIMEYFLS